MWFNYHLTMGLFWFVRRFFGLLVIIFLQTNAKPDTDSTHALNESLTIICPRLINDNCTKLKAPTSLQNNTLNNTISNKNVGNEEKSQQILTTGFSKLELENHSKSVIFVLGNTGSGKTTMTQTVNGNLSQLHAVLTDAGKLVVIDDNDRIGLPTTTSKTLVPEYLVNLENDVAFYDCPGFDDNRGADLDIAAMYYINSITENVNEAKFLFTVTQSSVTTGHDRNDFRLLTTHASKFLLNMKKFSDSIGLVVTKVDNFSDFGVCLNDTQVLKNVVEFLKKVQVTMKEESISENKTRELRQREIEFVESILKKDSSGEYSKIWFLRNPPQCGPFSKMPYMWEVRKKITNLYMNNLIYSQTTSDDFGFTLKDQTALKIKDVYVPEVKLKLEKNLTSLIDDLLKDSELNFTNKFTSEYEMKDALLNIKKIIENLDELHPKLGQTQTFLQSNEAIFEAMGHTAPTSYVAEVEKHIDVLKFYEKVTMTSINRPAVHPSLLKAKVAFQNLKEAALLKIQDTIAPQIVSEIKNITAVALDEVMEKYQANFTEEFENQLGMKKAMSQINSISINLTKFSGTKIKSHFKVEDISLLFNIFQLTTPDSYLNKTSELDNLLTFYENETSMTFQRPAFDSLILKLESGILNVKENAVIYIRDVAIPGLILTMSENVSKIIDQAVAEFQSDYEKEINSNCQTMEALTHLNKYEHELREFSLIEIQDQSFTNEVQSLLAVFNLTTSEIHLKILKDHEEQLHLYEELTLIKVVKPSLKPSFSKLSDLITKLKKKSGEHITNAVIPEIFSQIEEIVSSLTYSVENFYMENFYDDLSRDTLVSKLSDFSHNYAAVQLLGETWKKRASAEYSSESSIVTISTDLTDMYSTLGDTIPSEQSESINELEKKLSEYGKVLRSPINRPLGNWLKTPLDIFENLGAKLELYKFFDQLIRELQTYDSQSAIEKMGSVKISSYSEALTFIRNLKLDILTPRIEKIIEEKANPVDKQHLSEIAQIAIPASLTFLCLDNKVVVEGNYVMVKNIYPEALLECEPEIVAELEVFATEALYFDADILESGKGLTIRVLAKKWEVVGAQKKITLTGLDALHETGAAASCVDEGENGLDGIPGKPGGPGGSFFGIYESITNGKALTIDVSGGAGGNGQDGSDGCPGRDGRDATKSDFPSIGNYEAEKYKFAVIGKYKKNWLGQSWKWHVLEGQQGEAGGNGGNGGSPGEGGHSGYISVTSTIDSYAENNKITLVQEQGENGKPGSGGRAGDGGRRGENLAGNLRNSKYWDDELWDPQGHQHSTVLQASNGADGIRGGNENGKIAAVKPKNTGIPRETVVAFKEYFLKVRMQYDEFVTMLEAHV